MDRTHQGVENLGNRIGPAPQGATPVKPGGLAQIGRKKEGRKSFRSRSHGRNAVQPAKAIRTVSGWMPPQAGRSAPDRKKVEERKFPIVTERTLRKMGGPDRVRSLEDRNPLRSRAEMVLPPQEGRWKSDGGPR